MQRIWAWTQCVAIDASVAGTIIRTFRYRAAGEKVKTWLYGLLSALLLFTAAAKRLQYSTLGMLQFIAPTLQFLIAVLLYGEAFTTAHAIAFAAIWAALGLYVTALLRSPSLPQPPE